MAHIIKDRVKETSTSTGTGTFSLAGAMTGFRAFSAVCSVGDTVRYAIQAVDSNGAPSGDWEVGYGTYSAANTLTRTTVVDSSNAGSAVNFAAGTKQVWVGMDAAMAGWVREKLTANRTYYVATTGSDSNNGLSADSPFLTIQKALDVVADYIDQNGYDVVVQLADGTYTAGATMRQLIGRSSTLADGAPGLTILGNTSTPANVVVSVTGTSCFTNVIAGKLLKLSGLKMVTTTSGNCVQAFLNGQVYVDNVEFGSCAGYHLRSANGGFLQCSGNYSITGGAVGHWLAERNGVISCASKTLTITGTPNFSNAFANGNQTGAIVCTSNTYSGSATGVRYSLSLNATISSGGGTLPGNSAGSTTTGGQYA